MDYLFQFEQDKYYALRRFPMAMRIKLDLCGYKLSIRDWSKLSRADRETLAAMPYDTTPQLDTFRERVKELVVAIQGDSTETQPCDRPALWENIDEVPALTRELIAAQDIIPPTPVQWAALSLLQRYTLVKLTREGAKNEKLPAALREFGLWSGE